jgi:hypothetical protein
MSATCKDCRGKIIWAVNEGRSLPFEPTTFGAGTVAISKIAGTYRARPHRGSPSVQAYRRHDCPKRRNRR